VSHGRDERGEALFAIASRQVGVRKALGILTFMAAWDRARKAMRRESITLHEYAEWWRESDATAYRHQARFRECFPGETTPDRLLDLADGQWVERRGLAGLGQVVVTL
jgi:hypothetical protein